MARNASARDVEIAVLGGGLAGLCCALELRRRGREVLVLDPHPEDESATWAAAGMLSPVPHSEADRAIFPLMLRALRFYPEYLDRLAAEGVAPPSLSRGATLAAETDADLALLEELADFLARRGFAAQRLTPRDLGERLPGLRPDLPGGLHLPEEARVDQRALRAACREAFLRRGGEIRGEPAIRLVTDASGAAGVAGVVTPTLEIRTRGVINAAGAWAGEFMGAPGDGAGAGEDGVARTRDGRARRERGGPPPVHPVKGQMISVRASLALAHVVRGRRVYLVPRPGGRIWIGSTLEDVGFAPGCTVEGVRGLLSAASALFPPLSEARIESLWWGFRPGTRDGLPIVGRDVRPGLVHAAGFFRSGILLAPLAGDAVADLVEGREADRVWEGVSPGRWDTA